MVPSPRHRLCRHSKRGREFAVTHLHAYGRPTAPMGERGQDDIAKDRPPLIDEFVLISAQRTPSTLGVPSKEYHIGKRVRIAFSRRDATSDRRAFSNVSRVVEFLLKSSHSTSNSAAADGAAGSDGPGAPAA